MKKQYTAPEMKVVKLNPSEIICVSFGDGETNVMYARRRNRLYDDDNCLWDELGE